jgi:hypothetical protein
MAERIEDYRIVDTRTKHLTIPELITTFITTGKALQTHEFFGLAENWQSWLEGPTHYFDYADQLRVLDDAYRGGNKPKKAERDELRARAAFSYQLGGNYVTTRAFDLKRPELLLNTYPLKPIALKVSSSSTRVNQTEIVLTTKNGPTRTAILHGHHAAGGPYQVQFCKGIPTSEDSWTTMPQHYPTCGKISIDNLDSVSQYFFRIRYNGPLGAGPWSQVASLIIH